MQKYNYIYLGHGISKEAERAYNQLCRYEQYQEERDEAHGLMHYDDEKFNVQIADETTMPFFEEAVRTETLWNNRLAYLPYALELLKQDFPEDYSLIHDYYLSGEKVGLKYLAVKHGITHQMMSRRIAQAREKLKCFIILHENGH